VPTEPGVTASSRPSPSSTWASCSLLRGAGEVEEPLFDGILELLDAYRLNGTARVRQAALDAAVRQAEIELEFVSGWEIP